jgi:hypothetical protein
MKPKLSPRRVMGKPPVHSMVSPRAMLNMPSVATNGGSLNRVMTNPLNQPSAVPTNSARENCARHRHFDENFRAGNHHSVL